MEKHNILSVTNNQETYTFSYAPEDTILNVLQKNGILCHATCGGKGTCDHCKVLADGHWVKACQSLAKDYQTISLTVPAQSPTIVTVDIDTDEKCYSDKNNCSNYGIAIDIGTTTIALALVDITSHAVLHTLGCPNPQICYGADVLTRLQTASEGHSKELSTCLRQELEKQTLLLLQEASVTANQLKQLAISANTTMCHILLELPCDTLAVAPFIPYKTEYPLLSGKDIFSSSELSSVSISIIPGLDAFVGGDILSGLFSLDEPKNDDYFLFIDLGTNGEMVLGNQNTLYATSVAAGPAFEGSRIPGSDVLSAIHEMYNKKALDSTGLLQGLFFHTGYSYLNYTFTQEDIRNIQLAKASVRAGIEALLVQANLQASDISRIYLCGGFGLHTDVSKAIDIGMLPSDFADKVLSLGNTSLRGAMKALQKPIVPFADYLSKRTTLISLADSNTYKNAYVSSMSFSSNSTVTK